MVGNAHRRQKVRRGMAEENGVATRQTQKNVISRQAAGRNCGAGKCGYVCGRWGGRWWRWAVGEWGEVGTGVMGMGKGVACGGARGSKLQAACVCVACVGQVGCGGAYQPHRGAGRGRCVCSVGTSRAM